MHKVLILALVMFGTVACGELFDGESRDGELGRYDDVIQTDGPAGGGGADMVCEYPPLLSGAHHSIDLRDCAKLEGGQIGEDLTLDVNGETVVITDWINKEGEGEFVGFHVDGDVVVVVKAGPDLYEGGSGDWVHPGGTEGPRAKGISFVAFCEPPTDEPVCTPTGDPGDGGGGDGPGGDGGDGPGEDGGGDDDGHCDPFTCEPGGTLGGGDDGSGGSDGSSGGDGYTDPGHDDGSGSSTGGGSGSGSSSGSDGAGSTGSCAVTACGAGNTCGNNQACYQGCCINIAL